MRDDREFYIGYIPQAPKGLARKARFTSIVLLLVGAIVATLLIASHGPFEAAVYEFGIVTELEGVVRAQPYPVLEVERPGDPSGSHSRYLLVGQGKFGAQKDVEGKDGRKVTVEGSLTYRQGQTMLELLPDSVRELMADVPPEQSAVDLGTHSLVGEIVDSKCFLGLMNPGRLKAHKACAIRCISGGIPPIFHVQSEDRGAVQFLLVSEQGQAVNSDVLEFVAEPLEITGRVTRHDDLHVLWADPATYERLAR